MSLFICCVSRDSCGRIDSQRHKGERMIVIHHVADPLYSVPQLNRSRPGRRSARRSSDRRRWQQSTLCVPFSSIFASTRINICRLEWRITTAGCALLWVRKRARSRHHSRHFLRTKLGHAGGLGPVAYEPSILLPLSQSPLRHVPPRDDLRAPSPLWLLPTPLLRC